MSENGFRTDVFGPILWLFLGIIAGNYPRHPTKLEQKLHTQWFLLTGQLLPCQTCRNNFTQHLLDLNWNPKKHMRSRNSFSRFIYHLHAHINNTLGKDIAYTYREFRCQIESLRARTGPSADPGLQCIIQLLGSDDAARFRSYNNGQSIYCAEEHLLTL